MAATNVRPTRIKVRDLSFNAHSAFVEWVASGGSLERASDYAKKGTEWMPCPRCGSNRVKFDLGTANDHTLGAAVIIPKMATTVLFLFLPIFGWLMIPGVWVGKPEFTCGDCKLEWNIRDVRDSVKVQNLAT